MVQPFKRSAAEVLSDGSFLTADEIVEKAVQRKLLDPAKMTDAPGRTMSSVLNNNIRQQGDDSEFARRGDEFGLKRKRAKGGPAPGSATSDEPNQIQFNGRAGEYAVASELTFYGFDACLANIEGRTDVFAVKGGRCFFVQVKTSVPARNRCSFFIPPSTHEEFDLPDAYYAFVMRSVAGNDFLVMPYHEVQKQIEAGRIKKMSRKYRATFLWGDKITLDGADVTYYRRRWPTA